MFNIKHTLRQIGLCLSLSTTPFAHANGTQSLEQFFAEYSKGFKSSGLQRDPELTYQKQIGNILGEKKHKEQARFLNNLLTQRKQLADQGRLANANACQKVQIAIIDFETHLLREKLKLVEAYQSLGTQASISDQGLANSSMGKAWYQYLRLSWLNADVSPEYLMAMGHAELDRALAHYQRLQKNMGYEGRDAEFSAHLRSSAFQYPDGTSPQADYEQRQAWIYQNLQRLFLPNQVQAPVIKASDRGMSFPVDGYYLPEEGAFYFNKAKSHYDRRSLDWLLLHESTPGHHFQNRYAVKHAACANTVPHSSYSAYIEGWAAYVEEYGHELGLYQTEADELGAVEWNLVRSIRVILDVGINHMEWSDQQAHAFWQSKLPMLPELADREIKRVRNWPAQAITYKLGAVKFRQLRDREQARLGAQFDIRQFHHDVLKFGPLPLDVLEQVLAQTQVQAH
ncbi:MAG: DUF885 domain-containing protein [Burkholderiaceae bacterium]|nr:MAG: DUF885 domain-containing protein [Burkholderiaceae bacterium]